MLFIWRKLDRCIYTTLSYCKAKLNKVNNNNNNNNNNDYNKNNKNNMLTYCYAIFRHVYFRSCWTGSVQFHAHIFTPLFLFHYWRFITVVEDEKILGIYL